MVQRLKRDLILCSSLLTYECKCLRLSSIGSRKSGKNPETVLGLTRQELIKTQRLTHSSIVFCLTYLIISLYLFGLYVISALKITSRKLININSQVIFRILIPIFAFNFCGKALTFYSSYTSSSSPMRSAAFSQFIAFFLDIYFFLTVIGGGHKIDSGFVWDDILFILFVYFCIIFDIIYLFSTIVLSIQLFVYGFIGKPKVRLSAGSGPIASCSNN